MIENYINGPVGIQTLKKTWGISDSAVEKQERFTEAVSTDIYGTKSGTSFIPQRRNGKRK